MLGILLSNLLIILILTIHIIKINYLEKENKRLWKCNLGLISSISRHDRMINRLNEKNRGIKNDTRR